MGFLCISPIFHGCSKIIFICKYSHELGLYLHVIRFSEDPIAPPAEPILSFLNLNLSNSRWPIRGELDPGWPLLDGVSLSFPEAAVLRGFS